MKGEDYYSRKPWVENSFCPKKTKRIDWPVYFTVCPNMEEA